MNEMFSWGSWTKYIPKSQLKKLIKKMKKSYEIGDKLKEIGEKQREHDGNQAELELEKQLFNLD